MSHSVPLSGVHLSSYLRQRGSVGEQPSIFDILSQESLMSSLKPAIGHLIKYLAAVYPSRFSTASKWFDELYAAFDLIVQNHYLRQYGASFSENFYSMKRIVNATGFIPVGLIARLRSLVFLVIWPYIRGKLDKLQERLSLQLGTFPRIREEPLRVRLARLFLAIYPWLKFALSFWTFVLQFAYILSQSTIHSPLLKFAGVHLEKLTAEDIAAFERIPRHLRESGILNRLLRLVVSLPGVVSRLFGYGLLFIQFLDFFYNSDLGSQIRSSQIRSSVRIPPAPHRQLRESSVILLETNKCPICLRQRRNDTLLSVSGYVFCYGCIYDFVKREKKCPVTSLPANVNSLIRIFSIVPKEK